MNLFTSYSMTTDRKSQLTPAQKMASSSDHSKMDTAESEETSPPLSSRKHPWKYANYTKTIHPAPSNSKKTSLGLG